MLVIPPLGGLIGTPVNLIILVGQCIKSCRYKSGASVNIHIQHLFMLLFQVQLNDICFSWSPRMCVYVYTSNVFNCNISSFVHLCVCLQVSKSPKSGKRKRLERNSEINGSNAFPLTDTHSSPPSNSLAERDHESRSSSAEQSTDRQPFQTCQGTQEESVQTRTARCQSDSPDCCSGLRKTPPRSSKGCGRVCTACPCGTKVGGVAGNSASKPQEKPNPYSSVNSSKSLSYASNTDVTTVNRLADSVSGSTASNSASGVEMTPGSQSHVRKDVKGTMPTAAVLTSQPKGQPARKGSSSCTQGKTHAKSTSHQLETGAQTPSTPIEVKKVPSSVQQLYTSYKIPSELYSSVLLDPEEIKRQERIKRLKDLLQEKEAALEKLRKSM